MDFVLCVLKKGDKCVDSGGLQDRLLSDNSNQFVYFSMGKRKYVFCECDFRSPNIFFYKLV